MNENEMLMCLIAFILGYLVARMIRGNGFSIGGNPPCPSAPGSKLDNSIGDCGSILGTVSSRIASSINSDKKNKQSLTNADVDAYCKGFYNDNDVSCNKQCVRNPGLNLATRPAFDASSVDNRSWCADGLDCGDCTWD